MVSEGGTREYEKHGVCVSMVYIAVIWYYNNFWHEGLPKNLHENSYNLDRYTLQLFLHVLGLSIKYTEIVIENWFWITPIFLFLHKYFKLIFYKDKSRESIFIFYVCQCYKINPAM